MVVYYHEVKNCLMSNENATNVCGFDFTCR